MSEKFMIHQLGQRQREVLAMQHDVDYIVCGDNRIMKDNGATG